MERQIIIDRKRGRAYIEEIITSGKARSEVLAGFWIEVDWLWDDPLPDELDCLHEILGM